VQTIYFKYYCQLCF